MGLSAVGSFKTKHRAKAFVYHLGGDADARAYAVLALTNTRNCDFLFLFLLLRIVPKGTSLSLS